MSPDASTAPRPTLLSRVRSVSGFATACIAAVVVAMTALALAMGEFDLAF